MMYICKHVIHVGQSFLHWSKICKTECEAIAIQNMHSSCLFLTSCPAHKFHTHTLNDTTAAPSIWPSLNNTTAAPSIYGPLWTTPLLPPAYGPLWMTLPLPQHMALSEWHYYCPKHMALSERHYSCPQHMTLSERHYCCPQHMAHPSRWAWPLSMTLSISLARGCQRLSINLACPQDLIRFCQLNHLSRHRICGDGECSIWFSLTHHWHHCRASILPDTQGIQLTATTTR